MNHSVRLRPQGRYQCAACRAAWGSEPDAHRSAFACPGLPLAHGLPGTREHLVYPKALDRSCAEWNCPEADPAHWHGPDPYCDTPNCARCCHDCDCGVCTGALHAPYLQVLEDVPPHELARTPRRRNATMQAELSRSLAGLSAGDHVTAAGVDTRGHNVTRTGYLLAPPKPVNAQRNGVKTKGWRLFVGAAGTDPGERTTWVTVFPDMGAVQRTEEPQAGTWSMTELRHVPGVKASSHTTRILYGGKGGARSAEPTQATEVTVTYTGEGLYALWNPATDTTHLTCRLSTKIWWAHLPKATQQQAPSAPGERRETAPVNTPAAHP